MRRFSTLGQRTGYAAGVASGLPGWVKVAYGGGAVGWVLIDRIVITWLYTYYVTSEGDAGEPLVLPLVFGAVMFGGRVIDAIADPLIARLSDNHRGRLGRRLPFMLTSGVLYVAVYAALFHPPAAFGPVGHAVYLGVLLGAYFTLFTAYVGPYLALMADLSRQRRDRVDLATSKAVATLAGSGIGLIASGPLVAALGVRGMVVALGLAALVLLYVPGAIPERRYARAEPATMALVPAVRATFANRPFLVALVGINALWFAFNLVTINIPLYVTSLLGLSEEMMALVMGAVFGVALVVFPAANILAKRWGLKRAMILSLALFAATFPVVAILGWAPPGLTPLQFAMIGLGLTGIPLAGFFIVPDTLIATVADLDTRRTGQRREGMYFGVQGLVLKLNLGVSTLVSGGLLQWFGDPLGIRLTGVVAAVVLALGALALTRYPEAEVEAERAALPGVGAEAVDPVGTE